MLAALLCNVTNGGSSHDGWLRQYYRERASKKERGRLAAELKRLHRPSPAVDAVTKPFTRGDEVRWLALADDRLAIARYLDALQARRDLLDEQAQMLADAEAIAVLEMSDAHDREIVRAALAELA